ncbi:MAG: PIN domain-containing protein [Acidimicrobiales bacterium]
MLPWAWRWTRCTLCDGDAAPPRCEVHEGLRVLADTNVLVAAVTSNEGVSARLLIAARSGRYRLIVSPDAFARTGYGARKAKGPTVPER